MSTPRIWLGISSDEWLINSNTPHTRPAAATPARSTISPCKPLVAAFAADKAIVDESSTRTAVAEVTAD